MAKKNTNFIGGWAFLIGIVLAIIIALFGTISPTMLWVLMVLGLVIGVVNVTDEEATPFMMSGIVLIIAVSLGREAVMISPLLVSMLDALLLLFIPATIVVAIKNVFSMARH